MHRVNSVYTYTFTPIISLVDTEITLQRRRVVAHVSHSSLTARFFLSFFFFFSFFFYSSFRRFVLQSRLEERETAVTLADDSYATV